MTDVYHNVLCVRRAALSRYSSADETGNEPLRSSARSQGSDLELKRRGTTTLHEPCPNTSTFQLCRRKTERQHAGWKLKQQEHCDKAPPHHLPLRRPNKMRQRLIRDRFRAILEKVQKILSTISLSAMVLSSIRTSPPF